KLKEWERLATEGNKLVGQGKYAEAIVIGEKLLVVGRELFGKDHERIVGALEILSGHYEKVRDFAGAQKALQEALAIRTRLYGAEHWRVTDSRLLLEDSRGRTKLSAEQRQQLDASNEMNEKGIVAFSQADYAKAAVLFRQALDTNRQLIGEKNRNYTAALAN